MSSVTSIISAAEPGENVGPTALFASLEITVSHGLGGLSSNSFCLAFSNYFLWSQAMNINIFCIIMKTTELGSGNLLPSPFFP